MNWKDPTPEDWTRFGFIVLLIVGATCTLIIIFARMR